MVTALELNAFKLLTSSVPVSMAVVPVYAFEVVRVSVPKPVFQIHTVPEEF